MKTKKTIEVLPEKWEEKILEVYERGGSDNDVRSLIMSWIGTLSNDLWFRWLDEEPELIDIVEQGRVLSRAWWEEHGRMNLYNKEFNSTLWYMNMKNRFGWADIQKIDHTTKDEKITINLVRG